MTLEEQKTMVDESIAKYLEDIAGLHKISAVKEPEALHIALDVLRKKTNEELAEMSLELVRYSMYIQRLINRETAWLRWAESKRDEFAAHALTTIEDGYGWNERMLMAQNSPQSCSILNRMLREIQMKIASLSYLPNEIKKIGECIKDIRLSRLGSK